MAITDKEALQAAETIKAYCENQECDKCRFITGNDECFFIEAGRNGDFPAEWWLPLFSRWTAADKALAEALMLAGLDSIAKPRSKPHLHLCAGSNAIEDGLGLLDAFHDLKPGERISLEEIVNSKGERNDGE